MRRECFLWFMQEQEGTTWNNCMIIMNDHDILKVAFIRLPPSARLIGLELKTSSEDLPSELMKLLEDLRKAGLPWQSTAVWYLPQDAAVHSPQMSTNLYDLY